MKPIIELKNIKVHVGLSEETPAYTATIFVDGVKFALVSNDGHGGPDRYESPNGIAPNAFWKVVDALNKRIEATYPASEVEGMTIPESLECICHTAVWDDVEKKSFARKLAKETLFLKTPTATAIYALKAKLSDPRVKPMIMSKNPEAVILNELPVDEAFRIFQRSA